MKGMFQCIKGVVHYSPPLALAEVESNGAVADGLLVQVLGVTTDEGRHVVR